MLARGVSSPERRFAAGRRIEGEAGTGLVPDAHRDRDRNICPHLAGQAAALADTAPPRVPWVSRPTNPLAGWHVSRHGPSRATRHSTAYRGFARASRGSA